MLLVRYITRVAGPLVLAIQVASLTYLLWFPDISILLFSSYVGITFIATISLVKYLVSPLMNMNTHYQLRRFTYLTIIIAIPLISIFISIFAFPHVYLFFNALPLLLSGPLLHVTTTICAFEYILVRDSQIPDRADLSLITILSNPRRGIARLQEILEPNTHRARNALELRANLDNVMTGAGAGAKNQIIEQLTTRYTTLLAKFPTEAIIDDEELYKKHFNMLAPAYKTFSEEELKARRTAAAKNALQEAKKLEEAYKKTLSSEVKQKCYQNYRDVTLTLSIHATCPLSYDEIYSNNPVDFCIVEKRYTAPIYIKKDNGTFEAEKTGKTAVYAVPGRTNVYKTAMFDQILERKAPDPFDRDLFVTPTTYPNIRKNTDAGYKGSEGASYPTQYVYYPYTQIHGHGLSLQLCEAMEAFLDPTLEECKNAALQKTQAPAKIKAPTEEKMPQHLKKPNGTSVGAPSTLLHNSMFPRRPTTSSRRPSSSNPSSTIYHSNDTTGDAFAAAIAAGVTSDEIMANLEYFNRF